MNNPTKTPKLLTVKEVAVWLNISVSLVYQMVEAHKLPVHRIGTGRGAIRFAHQDVEEYIAASRTHPEEASRQRVNRPRLKHLKVK